jgi:hypothetical protein
VWWWRKWPTRWCGPLDGGPRYSLISRIWHEIYGLNTAVRFNSRKRLRIYCLMLSGRFNNCKRLRIYDLAIAVKSTSRRWHRIYGLTIAVKSTSCRQHEIYSLIKAVRFNSRIGWLDITTTTLVGYYFLYSKGPRPSKRPIFSSLSQASTVSLLQSYINIILLN